jgi:hypothetical protein
MFGGTARADSRCPARAAPRSPTLGPAGRTGRQALPLLPAAAPMASTLRRCDTYRYLGITPVCGEVASQHRSISKVKPVGFWKCSQVRIDLADAPVRACPFQMLQKPLVLSKGSRFPPSRQDERESGFPSTIGPSALWKHLPQCVPTHGLRAGTAICLHVFQQMRVFLIHQLFCSVLYCVVPRIAPL